MAQFEVFRAIEFSNDKQEANIRWFVYKEVDLPGRPKAQRDLATAKVHAHDYHGAHTKHRLTLDEVLDWLKNNDVTLRMNVYPTTYKLGQFTQILPATGKEITKIVNHLLETADIFMKIAHDYQDLVTQLKKSPPKGTNHELNK